jgi:hypothetical protein
MKLQLQAETQTFFFEHLFILDIRTEHCWCGGYASSIGISRCAPWPSNPLTCHLAATVI